MVLDYRLKRVNFHMADLDLYAELKDASVDDIYAKFGISNLFYI